MNTNKHIIRSLKLTFGILLLTVPFFGNTQESPWESKPHGENPWATEEEKEEAKETITSTVEVSDSTIENQANKAVTEKVDVAKRSTEVMRYFNINGNVIQLHAQSVDFYKSLNKQGRSVHKADGALVGGIMSSLVLNVVVLPVNMIAAAIPTPTTNSKIEQFKTDNPHATRLEIKAFNRGMQGKRFAKAAGGVGIGSVLNIGGIALLVYL
jgi:hypothetical protein